LTPDRAMGEAAALFSAGRLDDAHAAAQAIAASHPGYFHAWHLLAVIAARRGDFSTSIDLATRALSIAPNPEALSNRGAALRRLDRIEEALADYDRALALAPNGVETWNNRGVALAALNRHGEALAAYDRALAMNPQHLTARFNRGLSRLITGDFTGGWEDHEARWGGSDTQAPRREFVQPQWKGGSLEGARLLLHAEQGLGDMIQFARYVPLARERGAAIVIEAQLPLVALLRESFPDATVVARGDPLPPFDLHCPMLSLPLAFRTTLGTIPAQVPYLKANDERLAHWRDRLGPASRPRVGLSWSGSATLANDRHRSIPLEALAPLLVLDCDFVSLQKDVRASDAAALAAHPNLRHFGDELVDLRDTAALACLVDLVVSVDTAAAHVAGALGRKTWILLPFAPDWRWLLDRGDTPWYPTAKLFRQAARGDWTAVIDRVTIEARGLGRG